MDSKKILKLGAVLLIICVISTALLAIVNKMTLPVIEENSLKNQEIAKKEVLGEATQFEQIDKNLYKGLKDGEVVGYVASVYPKGYGGTIEMMVGIDKDMSVSGIKIISMSETPGLGAKAKDAKFTDQFKGKNKDFTLKKSQAGENEINAISGATVTSTAVTEGVKQAFELVEMAGGGKQ